MDPCFSTRPRRTAQPCGVCGPTTSSAGKTTQVGERARIFQQIAEQSGAVALGAFTWDSAPGVGGLRELPDDEIRDYQSVGAEISQRCGVPTSAPPREGRRFLGLQDCRFEVSAHWRIPWTGTEGEATAVPLSDDSGFFWFFSATNIEMTVKVLDGRAVNGHFWVFWSAMSTLDIELRVHDRTTGMTRTYDAPVSDTRAFPE